VLFCGSGAWYVGMRIRGMLVERGGGVRMKRALRGPRRLMPEVQRRFKFCLIKEISRDTRQHTQPITHHTQSTQNRVQVSRNKSLEIVVYDKTRLSHNLKAKTTAKYVPLQRPQETQGFPQSRRTDIFPSLSISCRATLSAYE